MKCLIINATFGDGSTGTIVRDIQQNCLRSGIDCKVAYAHSSQPQNEIKGWKIGNLFSNKLHALLSRINGKHGYFSYLTTLRLTKIIDEYQPDIINIHNLHSNFINLGILLNYVAQKDIPLLATLHDCWFFTGGCVHFTNANCDKWLNDCKGCPKKKLDTPAYFKDCAAEILADRHRLFGNIKNLTCVGVSEWITSQARQTVFKNASCLTIHNGIDTTIFQPKTSTLKKDLGLEGKTIILGPASKWLDPINSELLHCVSNALSDNRVLLLFGYNGKNQLNLPNVITYPFTTSKQQLAELYSIADMFANCSREDTLSSINIEAQACGTPLVTYDNTGSKETAHPELSDCVATGDYQTMARIILNAPQKNAGTAAKLHSWVAEHFDKDKNYRQYVQLFNHIAARP
ncbi:MAG: glycosyltransferase [Muribaculaceae bacterium]|nr:glycosyltransferase [Muribaculaceae bacterium]